MSKIEIPDKFKQAREKFLGLSLESTRKSYYPQLKQQLSTIQENEKRLRLLTDNLPARISFVDARQRYLFVNREYERAWGLPREKIIGRQVIDVVGPDNYQKVESAIHQALAGRRMHFEAAIVEGAGNPVWLEINYVPYTDADGKLAGFYALTQDVTERKRAEDALRESEAKNRELVQHAPAGIYEFDLERLRFTSVNHVMCEYTGYTEAEFLDLDPYTLLTEESRGTLDAFMSNINSGNLDPEALEYTIRGKSGREIKVLVNIRLLAENGHPKRVMAVAHDITAVREAEAAKKQMEAKLQETQKLEALGTLAGGMAHDFNNLLMGIQGNASLALLDIDSDHPLHRRLKNIEAHVQRGVDLTRQLLGLARGGKYEVRPTDLNELVKTSGDMFGRTKKEIQIQYHLEDHLLPADVDRGQIEQVLLNLFINAWHAMPDGGDLAITTGNVTLTPSDVAAYAIPPGRYVRVSVADTGFGIDPGIRRKIFDPFFTTKGIGTGTGLGLASAYGIIKNHHGAIDVDSSVGQGSDFFFYLPASVKAIHKPKSEAERLAMGSETILLIDDEAMVLDVGKQLLEALGYRVITAGSGQAAIEIYDRQAETIDLVILDMIMPQMGGSDTFDRLRTINPDVRVLLSSGYSLDGQATSILNRGCNGFIQKPFTVTAIAKKIREVLGEAASL
jgi:two-component system, cell cycle sensor histidine kinase and response regulator CckA